MGNGGVGVGGALSFRSEGRARVIPGAFVIPSERSESRNLHFFANAPALDWRCPLLPTAGSQSAPRFAEAAEITDVTDVTSSESIALCFVGRSGPLYDDQGRNHFFGAVPRRILRSRRSGCLFVSAR